MLMSEFPEMTQSSLERGWGEAAWEGEGEWQE